MPDKSPVLNTYLSDHLAIADDFLSFPRKKKHPEMAHRSHEFFDASLAPPFPTRSSQRQLDDQTDSRVREREREREGERDWGMRREICKF